MVDIAILAGPDADYGLVPYEDADAEALRLAQEDGVVVTVRCPVTDQVLATQHPLA